MAYRIAGIDVHKKKLAVGDKRLHATPAELRDALGACTELNPV